MIDLVTGATGKSHVGSDDVGRLQAYIAGDGRYILGGAACRMADSNTAHIDPGDLLVDGRFVRILGTGEDVAVENGTQGQRRNDIVALRYEVERSESGAVVESVRLVCVKGEPGASAADPDMPNAGSILDGDAAVDIPLYRIPHDGITVGTPEMLVGDRGSGGEFVKRSGDSMTGDLSLVGGACVAPESDGIDIGAATIPSKAWLTPLSVRDKNGNVFGNVGFQQVPTGDVEWYVTAKRKANGKSVWNEIKAIIRPDGTRAYSMSDPAAFRDALGVSDHVVAQGTSGIWQWAKYESGRAECWGTATWNKGFDLVWDEVNVVHLDRTPYPFPFASRPVEVATPRTRDLACWLMTEDKGNGMNSATETGNYSLARPAAADSSTDIFLDFNVVGRWK